MRCSFPLPAQMTHVGKIVYSNADACAWAEEVADGLAYLHSYNPQIIHRDVKLDNVLLRSAPCRSLLLQRVPHSCSGCEMWHLVVCLAVCYEKCMRAPARMPLLALQSAAILALLSYRGSMYGTHACQSPSLSPVRMRVCWLQVAAKKAAQRQPSAVSALPAHCCQCISAFVYRTVVLSRPCPGQSLPAPPARYEVLGHCFVCCHALPLCWSHKLPRT